MAKAALFGVLVVLAVASGCGDDDFNDDASSLRPADEILGERAEDNSENVAVGARIEADGVAIVVSDMQVGGDDFGPWLEVTVRAENHGEDTYNPNLAIVCDGAAEEGGWQADSTYDLNGELPKDSFNEGVVYLLLPEDPRTQEPVPECEGPAFVRVATSDGGGSDVTIDQALIDEMNAKRITG